MYPHSTTYATLSFDEVLRTLRDDPDPKVRTLVHRMDDELSTIAIAYREELELIEEQRADLQCRLETLQDRLLQIVEGS